MSTEDMQIISTVLAGLVIKKAWQVICDFLNPFLAAEKSSIVMPVVLQERPELFCPPSLSSKLY
jgi:hypothetical protein